MIRLPVVLAIARQDWAQELRGRRGWILPVLAGALLTPLAAAPLRGAPAEPPVVALRVEGPPGPLQGLPAPSPGAMEVPAQVRGEPGRWVVVAEAVPPDARRHLDGPAPAARVRAVPVDLAPTVPGRPLILTLLAASLMTGAISESLPGERSRRTLEALLTAAVTRWEIVLGKWGAWASLGALFAVLSSAVAVLAGQVDAGPWIFAVPAVPFGTVALGLYLVRRARDVVGGATVALRVLPAALSILGLIAWVLGLVSPWLGALVPLGGALVAAGGTWEAGPTVLAAALTLAGGGVALAATTYGLETAEEAGASGGGPGGALLWAGLGWWGALLGGVAWWPAGNPAISQGLPAWVALGAGIASLVAVWIIARAAGGRPPPVPPAWNARYLAGTLAGAVVVAGALASPSALPLGGEGWTDLAIARMDLGLRAPPSLLLLGVLAAVAQEALLRDRAQKAWGPWLALAAGVVVFSPHDPVAGALVGGVGALLTWWTGRWWLAAVARALGVVAVSAFVG